MTVLVELLESGTLVLGLLLAVAVEVAILTTYWFLHRRGVSPLKLFFNLGSGVCLIGALWVSLGLQSAGLAATSYSLILALLFFSLFFHLVDLVIRWQK